MLRNRWMLAGLGVAAAAGLFVLVRRQRAGGAAPATGSQASPAYSSGSIGTFDSTGTDVASWLGSYSGNLQNQLDEYKATLTDTLAGAGAMGAPYIPAGVRTTTYLVRPGDTADSIWSSVSKAWGFSGSKEQLLTLNRIKDVSVGQHLLVPMG